MQISGNTILFTGGGSGIGRALARAFAARGNRVIVAGRRPEALEETARGHADIRCMPLDVTDPQSLKHLARTLQQESSGVNVVFNNAGIMRREDWSAGSPDLSVAEATLETNLLGLIRTSAAVLPILRAQPHATLVNVSSGLAFVPLAQTPTYCASKAAVHSFTQSLRYQLRDSTVEVLELVPPYVATELMDGKDDPLAMPLRNFVEQTMHLFAQTPTPQEICVQAVHGLRLAERQGRFDATMQGLNQAREASRQRRASP